MSFKGVFFSTWIWRLDQVLLVCRHHPPEEVVGILLPLLESLASSCQHQSQLWRPADWHLDASWPLAPWRACLHSSSLAPSRKLCTSDVLRTFSSVSSGFVYAPKSTKADSLQATLPRHPPAVIHYKASPVLGLVGKATFSGKWYESKYDFQPLAKIWEFREKKGCWFAANFCISASNIEVRGTFKLSWTKLTFAIYPEVTKWRFYCMDVVLSSGVHIKFETE